MSAIPGGAVAFEFTGSATGLAPVTRDVERRLEQLQRTAERTKIDATPAIDKVRLQRDADDAKRILRGIQKEADRLMNVRAAGGGGLGRSPPGGLNPFGSGPLGSRGPIGGGGNDVDLATGGTTGNLREATQFYAIQRAAILFTTAATEIALAARDMKAAGARGDLAGQVRAESAKNAFARSMPFGIGELGGNIRELAPDIVGFATGGQFSFGEGERAGLERTQFEAEQVQQKAEFLARQNARVEGQESLQQQIALQRQAAAGATPSAIEAQRLRNQLQRMRGDDTDPNSERSQTLRRTEELERQAAVERAQIEGKAADEIQVIRDKADAERIRADGYTVAAERKVLVDGARQTENQLQSAIIDAQAKGNQTLAAHLGDLLTATQDANAQAIQDFDKKQAEAQQRAIDNAGEGAAGFMRGAGGATLAKADRDRQIAEQTSEIRFEARQAMLERRAETRPRAEFEAINERARRELAGTEDTGLRAAIRDKQAEELKTLLAELGGTGGRQLRAEAVQNAGTTFFGTGSSGKESERLLTQIDKTLKDIYRKDNVAVAG